MKITKLIFSFWTNKTKFILATVLATIFGLLISIFTMKFSFPDESAHYLRAVEVGHGHFLNGENNIGVPISCDDYLVIAGIAVGSVEKENIGKALDSGAKTVKETTNTVIDKTIEFKDKITK